MKLDCGRDLRLSVEFKKNLESTGSRSDKFSNNRLLISCMPFFLGGTSDVPDVLPVQGSVRSNRFWFSGNLHESVVSSCLELRKAV